MQSTFFCYINTKNQFADLNSISKIAVQQGAKIEEQNAALCIKLKEKISKENINLHKQLQNNKLIIKELTQKVNQHCDGCRCFEIPCNNEIPLKVSTNKMHNKFKNAATIINKSSKYLEPDSLINVLAVCHSNNTFSKELLSNHNYWEELYPHGFISNRHLLWKIYYRYILSTNFKPQNENVVDNLSESKPKTHIVECDNNCLLYYEIQRNSCIGTQSSARSKEGTDLLKSVVKLLKLTDYWLLRHGLVYFVSLISTAMKEDYQACLEVVQCLMGEPYHLDKLYQDDYYLLNLIAFQICMLVKQKLPEVYKHLKSIGMKLSNILIKWVGSIFYDKEAIYMPSEVVLRIFDLFLLSGWKAIIVASAALLKILKDRIMQQQDPDSIQLLFTSTETRALLTQKHFFLVYDSLSVSDDILYDWERMYVAKQE